MSDALVIGVDASTTAVKAIAFDRSGRAVAEARHGYPLHRPRLGFVEQDPTDWRDALHRALTDVARTVGANRVQALAIGQQRETFAPFGPDLTPLHRGILWLDERARREVAALSSALGRDLIRQISGKPPDPTPSLYSLAWLKTHQPQALAKAEVIHEVHGYLVECLTGERVTSVACADPMGLVDVARGTWSPLLMEAAGVHMDQLPALVKPGAVIGPLTTAAAAATGLPQSVLVVAGAGDGQMSGLGVGALGEETAYLSLGSGVVTGQRGDVYVTDDAYRTLSCPTGSGYMFETVLRSGMQLVDWLMATTGRTDIAALVAEATRIEPGSEGVMVMPYWSGVMNPYWDEAARGVILGLNLSHTPAHLMRAVLEGIALEQAVASDAMARSTGRRPSRFVACGGGVKNALLMDLMAAALERPLAISPVAEGVAVGAAVLAARAVGWFDSLDAAVTHMVAEPIHVVRPTPALVARMRPLIEIYRDVYPATRAVAARLYKDTTK
jgi:xylulokinase